MFISGRPKIVVTIHGIRTHGKWQKAITPILAKHGLIPYHIDYGWFGALGFYIPWLREWKIRSVRAELRALINNSRARRVSVIAHSFGTYIALAALCDEQGALLYDRVVLTGSILPCDFDWEPVFKQKWAMAALNVRADADCVVGLADWVYRKLNWNFRYKVGKSGREKFEQRLPVLLDDELYGGHSVAHNELRFEQWARFIAFPDLPPDVLASLNGELEVLRQHAAAIFTARDDEIRTSLFVLWDGALRLLPGACDNMNHAPEHGLVIQPGHGAVGEAFELGKPTSDYKAGGRWRGSRLSASRLPGRELAKLDPRLQWVLSFPLCSETLNVLAVVNVDGFGTPPNEIVGPVQAMHDAAVIAVFGKFHGKALPRLEAAFQGKSPEVTEV